ncbi:MAG: hypothetical protein M3Y57_19820 [Acidobacteriota bacterium]|nr:hypothetical protein [Acidobacteriota bacterium]
MRLSSTPDVRLLQVGTFTKEHQELRDKFATAALAALLSNLSTSTAFAALTDKHREEVAHERLASEAYRWADAMLKARDQPNPIS